MKQFDNLITESNKCIAKAKRNLALANQMLEYNGHLPIGYHVDSRVRKFFENLCLDILAS